MSTSSQDCVISPHQPLVHCADTWLMNINTLSLEEWSFISCPLSHFSFPLSCCLIVFHIIVPHGLTPTPPFSLSSIYPFVFPSNFFSFLILSPSFCVFLLSPPCYFIYPSLSLPFSLTPALSLFHVSSLCMSWDSIKGAGSKFAAGGGASVGGMV